MVVGSIALRGVRHLDRVLVLTPQEPFTTQFIYAVIDTTNDCALDIPEYLLLDLTGDGLLDFVVVEAPCEDAGVGYAHWWVHGATCDL